MGAGSTPKYTATLTKGTGNIESGGLYGIQVDESVFMVTAESNNQLSITLYSEPNVEYGSLTITDIKGSMTADIETWGDAPTYGTIKVFVPTITPN